MNPVTKFNRVVMRNPLKWSGITGSIAFAGVALVLLAITLEHHVGSASWYFSGAVCLGLAAMAAAFAWFARTLHKLERQRDD